MRLGRIGYINCYPVYGAIDRGIVKVPAELVTGTPSELNNLLAASQLEMSVVSAVEYARNAKAYHLLPDIAISSDGPVQSVVLFARREVTELEQGTFLVSASSRTSVCLLELLCRDLWRVTPRLVEARAEASDLNSLMALPHDAVLVIGDAALHLTARRAYPFQYDLGQVWKEWTGLPFVFAVWAARREADRDLVREVHQGVLASRDWGLSNVGTLSLAAAKATGFPAAECAAYLGGLDYAFTYRHLEGLTSFLRRLAAYGMVKDGALAFLSVA